MISPSIALEKLLSVSGLTFPPVRELLVPNASCRTRCQSGYAMSMSMPMPMSMSMSAMADVNVPLSNVGAISRFGVPRPRRDVSNTGPATLPIRALRRFQHRRRYRRRDGMPICVLEMSLSSGGFPPSSYEHPYRDSIGKRPRIIRIP
jgi:hypothetical protein